MNKTIDTEANQNIELFINEDKKAELHINNYEFIQYACSELTLPELMQLGAIIQGLIVELEKE